MPISSGANDWPAEYFTKPAANPQAAKVVVVPRPKTPIIARPAPDHTPQVLVLDQPAGAPPPPMTTTTYITQAPPSPQKVMLIDQPQPYPSTTTIIQQPPLVPPSMPPQPVQYFGAGPGVRRYPPGYGSYPNYYGYGGQGGGCFSDPNCCADPYFTTGVSGANAGCCQGGMFGSRRYPFHPSQNYILKGTGRGRCCACVWGSIIGLAALGLLLGMLLGYLPTTQVASAKSTVVSQYAGGYWYNGVYYYPITNKPDVFYYALGPGIPCNQFNNNSNIAAPATAGYTIEVSDATGIVTATVPAGTTGTTLPDCQQVTTSFVLAAGISVPTTTVKWQIASSTAVTCFSATLMHYIAIALTAIFAKLLTSF